MLETKTAPMDGGGGHPNVQKTTSSLSIVGDRTVVREWCREQSCPWWRYRHEHDVLSPLAGTYVSLMGARWAQ